MNLVIKDVLPTMLAVVSIMKVSRLPRSRTALLAQED